MTDGLLIAFGSLIVGILIGGIVLPHPALLDHAWPDTEVSSEHVLTICDEMADFDPALDLCFDLVHALELTDR